VSQERLGIVLTTENTKGLESEQGWVKEWMRIF